MPVLAGTGVRMLGYVSVSAAHRRPRIKSGRDGCDLDVDLRTVPDWLLSPRPETCVRDAAPGPGRLPERVEPEQGARRRSGRSSASQESHPHSAVASDLDSYRFPVTLTDGQTRSGRIHMPSASSNSGLNRSPPAPEGPAAAPRRTTRCSSRSRPGSRLGPTDLDSGTTEERSFREIKGVRADASVFAAGHRRIGAGAGAAPEATRGRGINDANRISVRIVGGRASEHGPSRVQDDPIPRRTAWELEPMQSRTAPGGPAERPSAVRG